MTLKLIGMVIIGCAIIGGATFAGSGLALAERLRNDAEATNPAVRMAIAPSFSSEFLSDSKPANAPAFLLAQEAMSPSLTLQAPPLRITESYSRDERPFADNVQTMDVEFALSATTRAGIDVELAPRAGFAVGPEGRTGTVAGAELRIGQGIRSIVRAFDDEERPSWYFFAATDGSALTWRPDTAEGGLRALRFQEERVVVGDAQIGVSAEFGGMQASLSVVNREISNGKDSTDQNFVGATFTWRR